MNEAPSIPDSGRNLPADLYGRFDICVTDDGSKQYSLPHTLGATVLALMSGRKAMLCVGALAAIIAIISPVSDPQSPLMRTWLYIALLFLLLHLVGAAFVMLFALITGTRKLTRISIREDGLVWNDNHFFPVEHIWSTGYGTTTNEGKPDEVFEPLVTVQIGTQKIVLAEGLDVASAKLFMRLFSDDVRRYWHRHN